MTIAEVVTGTTITSAKGNEIIGVVNDNTDDIATLNALVAAADSRVGIWWTRGSNQSVGATTTTAVTNTATTEASAGWSVASGVVTIPADGVYDVFAKVSTSGAITAAWITVDDSFDVALTAGNDRGGTAHFAGTAALKLTAGQNVRVYVRNPTAGAVNVTSANVTIWRVSK
jgi:hypothetical protein